MTPEITLIALGILCLIGIISAMLMPERSFIVISYRDRPDWEYKPIKATSIYSRNQRGVEFFVSKKTAEGLKPRDLVIVNGKYKGVIEIILR